MDRGYIHFKRLYVLAQAAAFFVVRTRLGGKRLSAIPRCFQT
jgi:hypothetical protein